MRYANPLDELLSSRAKVRILRFLAASPGEHSGREIARYVGMGETPTNRALRALSETLVVIYRCEGRAHYYRLNQEYALVREVLLPLFESEAKQLQRAVGFILEGLEERIECAIVYGSAARHDESWASDLDLLLLVPTEEDVSHVREALEAHDLFFLRRYGVVSPQVMTTADALMRLSSGEPWIRESVRRGQFLWGKIPVDLGMESAA